MMPETGAMFLGFPLEVVLIVTSGIFYFICGLVVWESYKKDRTELIGALLAFLFYQALAMLFMGLEMITMNMVYSILAGLSVMIGSIFMLKFPFSFLPKATRKIVFYLSIIIVLAVFIWFMLTPERKMMFMNFSIWYDIIINGIAVGVLALLFGLYTKEQAVKIKAVGGGAGIASCCVVANVATISGAVILSSVFQFLAPVIILIAIFSGRRAQVGGRNGAVTG